MTSFDAPYDNMMRMQQLEENSLKEKYIVDKLSKYVGHPTKEAKAKIFKEFCEDNFILNEAHHFDNIYDDTLKGTLNGLSVSGIAPSLEPELTKDQIKSNYIEIIDSWATVADKDKGVIKDILGLIKPECYDYEVVCDTRNNSQEDIDQSKMFVNWKKKLEENKPHS